MTLPSGRAVCFAFIVSVVALAGLSLPVLLQHSVAEEAGQLPEKVGVPDAPAWNAGGQALGANQAKGEKTFTAISSGSAFGVQSIGARTVSVPPADAAMRGGSVFIVEAGYCGEKLVGKYMSVLFLDQEGRANTFTTNQIASTASLKLKGTIRRWEHDCDTRKPSYKEIGGGPGGMEVYFMTSAHIRPRFFQVLATSPASVRGRIWGPGWEDNLRANAQVPGQPVAFSYAQSENQMNFDPAVLAAMKRSGIPVPDKMPDFKEGLARVKAAGFEIADINKPYFHGSLAGTETISLPRVQVPKLSIFFHVSSTDVDAEMLVYKPKGLSAATPSGPAEIKKSHSSTAPDEKALAGHVAQQRTPAGRGQTGGAGGYVQIPDSQQNSAGVQALVNLDNDDKNGVFDNSQQIVPGEDDLVKVVLRVKLTNPTVKKGKARFRVKDEPKYVQIWEFENKSVPFNPQTERHVDGDFKPGTGEFSGYFIKEIWIEGVEAHTGQTRTTFEFSFFEESRSTVPDKVETFVMTVLGIESIEWKGVGNSVTYGDNLDADPNYKDVNDSATVRPKECGGSVSSSLKPGAVRVFPGARVFSGEIDPRSNQYVRAEVKLSAKPVEPITFYFDSFDVDDPSASGYETGSSLGVDSQSWIDQEFRRPEDNRGSVKSGTRESKSGRFVREGDDGILAQEFTEQTQLLTFQVTMQPGDNFRIVGSGDKDLIRNLENDDERLDRSSGWASSNENKQRIVDASVFRAFPNSPEKAEIQQSEKYASKVLTVWRYFYAEIDSMEAIGENRLQVRIKSLERDQPARGQTKLLLYGNLTQSFGHITNVVTWRGNSGIKDSLRDGKMQSLTKRYKILGNSAEEGFTPDYVIVEGLVPDTEIDQIYTVQDDDEEKWGFKPGLALADAIPNRKPLIKSLNTFCSVAERYQPAYVLPDFDSLNNDVHNRKKFSPFLRNLKLYEGSDAELLRNYRFDNMRWQDSELLWTVYILQAYKGATYEDGDPDGESAISGLADSIGLGIHVFLEGLTERTAGFADYTAGGLGEKDCIAHEIGHLFGGKHEDLGLMGGPPTGRLFSKRTVARIRDAKHP